MRKSASIIFLFCFFISMFLTITCYAEEPIEIGCNLNQNSKLTVKAGNLDDIKENDFIKGYDLDVDEDSGVDVLIVTGDNQDVGQDISGLTNETIVGEIISIDTAKEIITIKDDDNNKCFFDSSDIELYFNGVEAVYTGITDIYKAVEDYGLTVKIKVIFKGENDSIRVDVSYATYAEKIEEVYHTGDLFIDGIELPIKIDDNDNEIVDCDNLIIEGYASSLEEIQKNDIVTVFASDREENTGYLQSVRLIVTRETVEGKTLRQEDDDTFIIGITYFDTSEYKMFDSYKEVKLGDEGIFYLDENGDIFSFDMSEENMRYGVIIGVKNGDLGKKFNKTVVDDLAQIKIATSDNEKVVYDLYSSLDYSGYELKSFELQGLSEENATYLSNKAIIVNESLSDNTIIKYGLNDDNQIDRIKLVDLRYVNLELSGSNLGDSYRFTEDTIIYDANNDYNVIKLSDITEDKNYNVLLLEEEGSMCGDLEVVIMLDECTSSTSYETYAMILDYDAVLNDDDEEVQEVTLLIDGQENTMITDDDNIVTNDDMNNNYYNLYELEIENDTISDVHCVTSNDMYEVIGDELGGNNALVVEAIDYKDEIFRIDDKIYEIPDSLVVYVSNLDEDYNWNVGVGSINDIKEGSFIKAYNLDPHDGNDSGFDVIMVFTDNLQSGSGDGIIDTHDLINSTIVGVLDYIDTNENKIIIEDENDDVYQIATDDLTITYNGAEAIYFNIIDRIMDSRSPVYINATFKEEGQPIELEINSATNVKQIQEVYDDGDLEIDGIELPAKKDENNNYVVDLYNLIIEGNASTLDQIQVDDIVTVFESELEGVYPQVVRLIVTRDTINGKVIKKYDDNTFSINGVRIDISEYWDFIDYVPQLGDEGTFYLDENGEIFAFEGLEIALNYGVIVGTEEGDFCSSFGDLVIDDYAKVKIATAQGETRAFELYSEYNNNDDYEPFESFELSGSSYEEATFVYDDDGWGKYIGVNNNVDVGTLVKYGLNSDNQIDELEIINTKHDYLKRTGLYLDDSYRITDDTIIFGATDSGYEIIDIDDIAENIELEVFLAMDEDSVFADVEAIIIPEYGANIIYSSIYGMILDCDSVLNSEDDIVQELTLLVDGEEVRYLTDDDNVITEEQLSFTNYNLYELTIHRDLVTDVRYIVDDNDGYETYSGIPYDNESVTVQAIDKDKRTIRFEDTDYLIPDDVIVYCSAYNTNYDDFQEVVIKDLDYIQKDDYIKVYNLDDDDDGIDVIIIFTEISENNYIEYIPNSAVMTKTGTIERIELISKKLIMEDENGDMYSFDTTNIQIFKNGEKSRYTDLWDIRLSTFKGTVKIKAIFEGEEEPIKIEVSYATDEKRIYNEYVRFATNIDEIKLPVKQDEHNYEVVDFDNLIIEGDVCSLEDIKEDDIVTIFAADLDKDDNHPMKLKLIVTRDTLEGKVVKKHDSNTYTINDIEIDSSAYNRNFDYCPIELGDRGIFYLDEKGEILSFDETILHGNYGVILGIEEGDFYTEFGETSMVNYAQIKIANNEGEEIIYDLYSKYDSDKDDEPFDSFESFELYIWYDEEYKEATYVREENGEYSIAVNKKIPFGTLIKYGLNGDNQIDELEIVDVQQWNLKVSGSVLGNWCRFTDDTIIFGGTDKGYDIFELDDIVQNKDLDVLFVEKCEDLEAIIIPAYGIDIYDEEYALILDVDNIIDNNGDIVQELRVLIDGEERTYLTDSEDTVPSIQDEDFYFNLYELTLCDDVVVKVDEIIDDDECNIVGDSPYGDESVTVQAIDSVFNRIRANDVVYTISDNADVYIYENNKYDLVDISYLQEVSSHYASKIGDANYDSKYDLNNDGIINIYDLVLIARQIK